MQVSGLCGPRGSATDIRAEGLISYLCCAACQLHSWANNSLLMARWPPGVLSNRMSMQGAPQ